MNNQPTEILESNSLVLRKVKLEDWLVLYKTITCKKFPANLPLKNFIKTEVDAQKWVKDSIQKWNESKRFTWTLCLKEKPDLVVGQVSITKRVKSFKWGIAFWISHEFQKRGYAKEAVVTLTERLKAENGLRFFAGASLWNEASNRVLIDSGFKKVRTHQNGYVHDGKTMPEAMNEYEKV